MLAGLGLLGAGVWAEWGWPLAAVVEGVTMITIAVATMPGAADRAHRGQP